jgi:hypothetical protein
MCESIRTGAVATQEQKKTSGRGPRGHVTRKKVPAAEEELALSTAARDQKPKFNKNNNPEPDMLRVEGVEHYPDRKEASKAALTKKSSARDASAGVNHTACVRRYRRKEQECLSHRCQKGSCLRNIGRGRQRHELRTSEERAIASDSHAQLLEEVAVKDGSSPMLTYSTGA